MKLTCQESGNYTPHPDGIHPAVCVDVIDRGQQPNFNGDGTRPAVMLVFETEQKDDDGHNMTISRTFTASLHAKAALNKFLGQWRGKPIAVGEEIDLNLLLGKSLTLVISHESKDDGGVWAKIETASKATKKLTPSGHYDGDDLRRRLEERDNKQNPQPKAAAPTPRPTAATPAAAAATDDDDVPF